MKEYNAAQLLKMSKSVPARKRLLASKKAKLKRLQASIPDDERFIRQLEHYADSASVHEGVVLFINDQNNGYDSRGNYTCYNPDTTHGAHAYQCAGSTKSENRWGLKFTWRDEFATFPNKESFEGFTTKEDACERALAWCLA